MPADRSRGAESLRCACGQPSRPRSVLPHFVGAYCNTTATYGGSETQRGTSNEDALCCDFARARGRGRVVLVSDAESDAEVVLGSIKAAGAKAFCTRYRKQ